MFDTFTASQRHEIMASVRSEATAPELILRHALWHNGFRYRINDKRLPGSPDIVLPKYRTVLFVHGCFWHGHANCSRFTIPKTNPEYWSAKISHNKQRDQEVWRQLESKGWAVIIVWECQLKKTIRKKTVANVCDEIINNGVLYYKEKEERKRAREVYRNEIRVKQERRAFLLKMSKGLV